jgi:hypothetical protein
MKKLLVIILLFCSFHIFAQVGESSRLSNGNELFISLSTVGLGKRIAPNDNVWLIQYRLLNIYYIIDKRFGLEFSPFDGYTELASFNDSLDDMLSNTINFFNFKFNYYFFMDYLTGWTSYFMFGPYISIHYLNYDNITGFGMNKIIMDFGFNIAMIDVFENTPFTILGELNIGYRFSNYTENKHSFYFTWKFDPSILFFFWGKYERDRNN